MRMKLAVSMWTLAVVFATAADQPIDLSGADTNTLQSHLGRVVTLCGKLEERNQGLCLVGSTATNVFFYVRPLKLHARYEYPKEWLRLKHEQVRVTGTLRFWTFDHTPGGSLAKEPDFFFMELRRATIERLKSK
jgi:hypothetical protein